MSTRGKICGALFALTLMSAPAFACKGPDLQFSDDFSDQDPAWNDSVGNFTINSGKVNLNSDPGKFALVFYQGSFFPTGDMCVDVVSGDAKDQTSIIGGLIFNATDKDNFYAFIVRPDGEAGIVRRQNGGWLFPVPEKKFAAVKGGAHATNVLRLTLTDTTATAYVNDQLLAKMKIQSNDQGMIGLYAEPEGGTWQFGNVKVTD